MRLKAGQPIPLVDAHPVRVCPLLAYRGGSGLVSVGDTVP